MRTSDGRPKTRILAGLLAGMGLLICVLAGTHLVYVATTSQPDCVPHLKAPDGATGAFRAAKPAC